MIMRRKNIILSTFLSLVICLTSACSDDTASTTVNTTGGSSFETEVSEITTIKEEDTSETEIKSEASETEAVQTTTMVETSESEPEPTVTEIITEAVVTTAVSDTTVEITTEIKQTEVVAETEQTTTAKETKAETEETTVPATEEVIEKKYIALTFDDGPNTTTTNDVLDVLEKYDIVASFFLIGNNINTETESVVKRAFDMGCEIGNHSKTHSYMTEFTVEEIIAEIDYVNDYVEKITGKAPTFFRPPYISVNDRMLETIEMPFIAGFGANDWEDRIPAEKRAQMIIRQAKNGGIILLHDAQGNYKTVEALDTIIPELQAQGYEFVTVTGLFEALGVTPQPHDRKIYTYADQQYMYG